MQTRLRVVRVRDPITVLLTWKPHLRPGHPVLLMLLKRAKKRIALLIAEQNPTARRRTSGWLKEDYVWKPGDFLGVHLPVSVASGPGEWKTTDTQERQDHQTVTCPKNEALRPTTIVHRRHWQVVRAYGTRGGRRQCWLPPVHPTPPQRSSTSSPPSSLAVVCEELALQHCGSVALLSLAHHATMRK